jgi:hypothetical protein
MRAEEGDETVNEYAAQAAQTQNRIRSQRLSGSRIAGMARRFAHLWKGEHPAG